MRRIRLIGSLLTLAVALISARPAPASGVIYEVDYPGSDRPGELIYGVKYRMWIPEAGATMRGVIVHQHGCGKGACEGGLTAAEDIHWQALAKKWKFALIGPSFRQEDKQNCRLWCDPRNGSRDRFLQALKDLGRKSGHPEVETVPWCLWGHSGGAFWSSLMQISDPDRVIAVWLRSGSGFGAWEKGEIPKPEISEAVYKVPFVCNPGLKERDNDKYKGAWDGPLAMFKAYRAKGAPVAFAPDPRTAHECGDSRYLAIPYFDAMIAARLPKSGNTLLDVDPSKGWVAPLLGEKAEAASGFKGDTKDISWFPTESVAKAWEEYNKSGYVTDTTPPPAPWGIGVFGMGDKGLLTWECDADLESGIKQFVIVRDGKEIARVPETPKNNFGKPIFQSMSYHDTPTAPVAAMEFPVPKPRKGQPSPSYDVISINGAGIPSKPIPPRSDQ